jgi:uncharacterized protein YecE (DUF72 family)
MAGRLYAGTSGFSYPEWKGSFYPEDLAQSGFLAYYAGKFDTVEVNNTFYRFPAAKVLAQWSQETGEGFRFAIKANQRITHKSRLADTGPVVADFVERCHAIGDRLGPILFQLPPYLRRDDERLGAFLATLPAGVRYAMEFRHRSWFTEEVYAALAGAGVALVLSEDEKLETPRTATAGFCYLRLRKERYDAAALAAWREWIHARLAEGCDVYAYFKHDEAGASPEAAVRLLA